MPARGIRVEHRERLTHPLRLIERSDLLEDGETFLERGSCARDIALAPARRSLRDQRPGELVSRAAPAERVHRVADVPGGRGPVRRQQRFAEQAPGERLEMPVPGLPARGQYLLGGGPSQAELAGGEVGLAEPERELGASEPETRARVPLQHVLQLDDALGQASGLDEAVGADAAYRGRIVRGR